MRTMNNLIAAGLVATAAWFAGCGDDADVRSYDVPKEQQTQPDLRASPHRPHPDSDAPIDWDVPKSWRKLPGERSMRVATFEADGPDGALQIAVSMLRGDGGGILPNVNRWRGQLGLGPIARTDLDEHVKSLAMADSEACLVDLAGAGPPAEGDQPRRIVVAVVPLGEATWFVKAIDKPSAVEPHKDAIAQFARSFRAKSAH